MLDTDRSRRFFGALARVLAFPISLALAAPHARRVRKARHTATLVDGATTAHAERQIAEVSHRLKLAHVPEIIVTPAHDRRPDIQAVELLGGSRHVIVDQRLFELPEDEQCAILGHEMGHFLLDVQPVRRALALAGVVAAGAALFAIGGHVATYMATGAGDGFGVFALGTQGALALAASRLPVAHVAQRQELACDRVSVEVVGDAGIARRALARWVDLTHAEMPPIERKLRERERTLPRSAAVRWLRSLGAALLSTHPSVEQRLLAFDLADGAAGGLSPREAQTVEHGEALYGAPHLDVPQPTRAALSTAAGVTSVAIAARMLWPGGDSAGSGDDPNALQGNKVRHVTERVEPAQPSPFER